MDVGPPEVGLGRTLARVPFSLWEKVAEGPDEGGRPSDQISPDFARF